MAHNILLPVCRMRCNLQGKLYIVHVSMRLGCVISQKPTGMVVHFPETVVKIHLHACLLLSPSDVLLQCRSWVDARLCKMVLAQLILLS